MDEFFKLAANYGFPMVVAGYLLARLEPPHYNIAAKEYHLVDHRGGQTERNGHE